MYIVEGNIGAGKSTFLTLINEHISHINIALEPLNNWQSQVYGQSLLANFYQDSPRWAFTMETFAMICRMREHVHEQQQQDPNRIMERSVYSGHYCFSLNGYKQGFVSDLEWQLYLQWFNFLIPQKCVAPLGFIYLRTDPDIAYARIKKRNRLAEKKLSLAYLKQIHNHHEAFLINKEGVLPSIKEVPVLVLDVNKEFENSSTKLHELLEKVQDFMLQTQPMSTIREVLHSKQTP